MSLHALVDLSCPHCHKQFVENAKLVRAGGNAWCPECEQLFALDDTNEAMRQMLEAAKTARRRRKDRLNDLKLRWADPQPQATTPAQAPRTLTEVLSILDALLLRLDDRDDRVA
jgi:predicted amidophosphoribosyltransferase